MLLTILGGSENPQILRRMGGIDSSLIHSGEYWRLLTAIFMHVGIIHLAVNGLSLIIIGKLVEQFFGTIRFVSIYLISGIGGSIASYTFIDPHVVGAGASAAIFGCLGALGSFFLIKHQSLGYINARNRQLGSPRRLYIRDILRTYDLSYTHRG